MIKTFILAAALVSAVSVSAYAGQCQDDIRKIDAAVNAAKLDADKKAEVNDLREQAVQLCGAGNEKEGLDVTAQAKQVLNIE